MSIIFICENDNDFERFVSMDFSGKTYEKSNEQMDYNGYSIRSTPNNIAGLRGTLIAVKKDAWDIENVIKHEQQHTLDNFFREEGAPTKKIERLKVENKENKKKETLDFIRKYFEKSIQKHEPRIKTEILANIRQGTEKDKIIKRLTRSKKEGGAYDYLDKENYLYANTNLLKTNFPIIENEAEDFITKIVVDEYKRDIERGIDAVYLLKEKGYPEDILSGEFMPIPLKKWLAVAKDKLIYDKRYDALQ